MDFRVELRQHVGERAGKFGPVKVHHNQDIVYLISDEIRTKDGITFPDGLEIGFAGHGTGTIEFLPYAVEFGDDVLQKVCEEVGRITGFPRTINLPPRPARVNEETGARVPDLDEQPVATSNTQREWDEIATKRRRRHEQ